MQIGHRFAGFSTLERYIAAWITREAIERAAPPRPRWKQYHVAMKAGSYREMKGPDGRSTTALLAHVGETGRQEEYEKPRSPSTTSHGAYNSEAYFRGGTCSPRAGEHPWKRFLTVPS